MRAVSSVVSFLVIAASCSVAGAAPFEADALPVLEGCDGLGARWGGSGRGALGRGLVCRVSRMSIGRGRLCPRGDGVLGLIGCWVGSVVDG